jgi:ribose-phosphate pyrophosphokinase
VTAFLPYLAYTRQDKDQPGKSLATAWAASVLEASGIDEVVTVDVHSERDKQFFNVPLVSVFPAELFVGAIVKHGLVDATIVAPDSGAIWRCEAIRRAMGMSAEHVSYFEKRRNEKGIRHTGPFGEVGTRVLIIDDMLDTGGTLVSACEKLSEAGAQQVYIMVTHGLFTGTEWKKLWSNNVERIFCTNTIPQSEEIAADFRITTISIAPLEGTPILFHPDLQWL